MNQTKKNSTPDASLLIYMTLMVLLITFIPFRFHVPAKVEFIWSTSAKNLISNILLFIPIGFLFRHSGKKQSRFYWKAIGYGVILSLAIEITQGFIIGRTTSGYDVIANGSGAFLGAGFFDYAKGKIKEQEPYRVSSLQIPLVNLVLLLTPLIWVTCLSSGNDPLRLYLLLLPLGIFGSGLLSSIFANRLAYTGISPNRFISATTVWFVLSTLPAMVRYPRDVAIIWLIMVVVILVHALAQKEVLSRNRRFEVATLKKLLPVYGVYLLLLLLLPATMGVGKLPAQTRLMTTIRLVEFIAAFAVLGYVTAEIRGRKVESHAAVLILTVCISAGLLVIIGLIKGSIPITPERLYHILPFILASLTGGIIYRFQLTAFKRA